MKAIYYRAETFDGSAKLTVFGKATSLGAIRRERIRAGSVSASLPRMIAPNDVALPNTLSMLRVGLCCMKVGWASPTDFHTRTIKLVVGIAHPTAGKNNQTPSFPRKKLRPIANKLQGSTQEVIRWRLGKFAIARGKDAEAERTGMYSPRIANFPRRQRSAEDENLLTTPAESACAA